MYTANINRIDSIPKQVDDPRDAPTPAGITPLFELAGIQQRFYNSAKKSTFVAVEQFDLVAKLGEFVSIVGPSGCGKSTLLGLLAGLTKPADGRVLIDGRPISGIQRDVGFIFQRDALLPWRTAQQNVELSLKYRKVARAERADKAREWLGRMGLLKFADYYPHQLSGGMRKRIAIAATLVYEPRLLLMDEPFSALDVQTRDLIENDILRLWQSSDRRQTIVFVTHDLDEAIAMSDRVVVMTASPGRIRSEYQVLLKRPRDLLEVRSQAAFAEIRDAIWHDLKVEVMRSAQIATR